MGLSNHQKLDECLVKLFKEVYDQARSHTSRDGIDRLIEDFRPSESLNSKEYRSKNKRRLSKNEVKKWISMVARIFTNNGMALTNVSDRLKEYLDTSPFYYNKKDYDLQTWYYKVALLKSIEDANGMFLVWPFKNNYSNKGEVTIPKVKFFNSCQLAGTIEYINTDYAFTSINQVYTYLIVDLDNSPLNTTLTRKEHWLVNDNNIILLRDSKDAKKQEPDLIWAFPHNFGLTPLVSPPSDTNTHNGYDVNESFLSGSFEYWDEMLTQFSDNQAIVNKTNFPVTIIDNIPCMAKGCEGGFMAKMNPGDPTVKCKACKGTGVIDDLSPFSVFRRPKKSQIPGANNTTEDPLKYIWAPVDNAKLSFERAFLLRDMGIESAGMMTVATANNESAVSRNMRFEQKQDTLNSLAGETKMFIESILWYMERYINYGAAKQENPTIVFPSNLAVKDLETLRLEVQDAVYLDRYKAFMRYVEEKYKGDMATIEAFEIAIKACPSCMLSFDEAVQMANAQVISKFDMYARTIVYQIVHDIIEVNPDMEELTVITTALNNIRLLYNATQSEIDGQNNQSAGIN